MISTIKEKIKEDPYYYKIIFKIIAIGLITIIGLGIFFVHEQEVKENKLIMSFNGFSAPAQTYFSGLSLNFNKVHCSVLKDQCTIKNAFIKAKSKKIKEDIFKINKIVFKNISKIELSQKHVYLNISLQKIEPINKLKEIIVQKDLNKKAKKYAKATFLKLFPININLIINSDKFNNIKTKLKGITSLKIKIKDQIGQILGNTIFETYKTKNFYSVNINKNGKIIKNPQIDKKMAKFKMTQKYYTVINSLKFSYINNSLIETIYDMYRMNTDESKILCKRINEELFGLNTEKELSLKEFKKQFIIKYKEYKSEDPNKIGKENANYLIGLLQGKEKEIHISLKNKNNYSIEDFLVLSSIEKRKKESILEKEYNIKISTK